MLIEHYLEGRSLQEIAAELGVSEGRVKRLLLDSRQAARKGYTAMADAERKGPRTLSYWTSGNVPYGKWDIGQALRSPLAYMHFPRAHWSKIASTNPLERQNKEIARRTEVVSIFPHRRASLRLATACLQEQDEERLTEHRYLSVGSLSEVSASIPAPVNPRFAAYREAPGVPRHLHHLTRHYPASLIQFL